MCCYPLSQLSALMKVHFWTISGLCVLSTVDRVSERQKDMISFAPTVYALSKLTEKLKTAGTHTLEHLPCLL